MQRESESGKKQLKEAAWKLEVPEKSEKKHNWKNTTNNVRNERERRGVKPSTM